MSATRWRSDRLHFPPSSTAAAIPTIFRNIGERFRKTTAEVAKARRVSSSAGAETGTSLRLGRFKDMQNDLLHRADQVLAESERLMDQLHDALRKAQQLNDWHHELQQLRIDQRSMFIREMNTSPRRIAK